MPSRWLSAQRVDEPLRAALALSGLVLVDDALRGGLVQETTSLVGKLLGCLDILFLDGLANLLDGGLELGADRLDRKSTRLNSSHP